MSTYFARASRLADETPVERNRVVDLMRVVSILVVVFGHWLMAAVAFRDGELVPGHLIGLADWTHPLTWVLQVMPIFFLVGGYSNALSLRSAERRGEDYAVWLRGRLRRLTLPVIPLLIVWSAFGAVALRAGLDWRTLKLASQVAIVPTWFIAVYVVIVALAPVGLRVWEHFGGRSIWFGLALAAIADLVSIGLGAEPIAYLNYVFVWATVHQLGYAWADGSFEGLGRRVALVLGGFLGVLALVWVGPYPVAMVGLGAGLTNSQPPRLTLLLLGVFQSGLVLVAEPILKRLMRRKALWTGVIAVSGQIMTLYLWHSTALVMVIAASVAMGGLGLGVEPLGGIWWLTRPVWFVVLSLLTVMIALVLGRFERPQTDTRPAPPSWRLAMAVAATCAGLGILAYAGIADPDGLNGFALSLPIMGMMVGGVTGVTYSRLTTRR